MTLPSSVRANITVAPKRAKGIIEPKKYLTYSPAFEVWARSLLVAIRLQSNALISNLWVRHFTHARHLCAGDKPTAQIAGHFLVSAFDGQVLSPVI